MAARCLSGSLAVASNREASLNCVVLELVAGGFVVTGLTLSHLLGGQAIAFLSVKNIEVLSLVSSMVYTHATSRRNLIFHMSM
jgi:hypothetical protein